VTIIGGYCLVSVDGHYKRWLLGIYRRSIYALWLRSVSIAADGHYGRWLSTIAIQGDNKQRL